MRYCSRCVQPDTRPNIYFSEDGVCGACLWESEKITIDWTRRENELKDIAEWAKTSTRGPYDCIVGVSGGKDSTFQALYARDRLGLHTLLVSGEPDGMTDIGKKNIENLKQLGFDVITLRVNPNILRKLVKHDFFANGNPGRATEYPLWASAYIIATHFNIPLVIQGENPGQTLGLRSVEGVGGDALSILRHDTVSADPFHEYTTEGITCDDLFMYRFRLEDVLDKGIKAIWLSYYAKEWSQPHNAKFSRDHGLTIRPSDTDPYEIGTYRFFSQLDARLLEVNQLLKYIKFGFGQATDHACYDIRDNLITREEGIFLVKELDGKCGHKFIQEFCSYIDITENEFWTHANSFRGSMWDKDGDVWHLNNPIWESVEINNKYSVREIINRLESGYQQHLASLHS